MGTLSLRRGSASAAVALLVVTGASLAQQFVTWEAAACEAGERKAKALGYRAICVTVIEDGTIFLIRDKRPIKLDKSVKFQDGDMLIGSSHKDLRIEGIVLKQGDTAVRTGGTFTLQKTEGRSGTKRTVSKEGPKPLPPSAPRQ